VKVSAEKGTEFWKTRGNYDCDTELHTPVNLCGPFEKERNVILKYS
jgi:hypothetical protein